MKRSACILFIILMLLIQTSLCEPRTIDLNKMSVKELDSLIAEIKEEKKDATHLESIRKDQLIENYKSLLEQVLPDDTKIKYPFLGLDASCERCCYQVWGDCSAKLADKSKLSLKDAHAIYWYNEDDISFYLVAFYTKDTVYMLDHSLLSNVQKFLDEEIVEKLSSESSVNQYQLGLEPIKRKLTDQEIIDDILSQEYLGYDIAFWRNVSVGHSWDYYFIDFDRNVLSIVNVQTTSRKSSSTIAKSIYTISITGNKQAGWKDASDIEYLVIGDTVSIRKDGNEIYSCKTVYVGDVIGYITGSIHNDDAYSIKKKLFPKK